jgi:DNA-binding transcriptional ArsR family regulator
MVGFGPMPSPSIALLDRPERLRLALSPVRRRLLDRLRAPASATELAAEMALGRQRVNYHLRALEKAGLVHLVETRQRRGCVERILASRADAFVVDPSVMGARRPRAVSAAAQDRYSAEHLIDAAGDVVRHVARMRTRAEQEGTRLLTFAIDTEVSFATPGDFERFTTALAAFVAREAAKVHTPAEGRRYRILLGGHPAPGTHAPGVSHGRSRTRRNPRRRTH